MEIIAVLFLFGFGLAFLWLGAILACWLALAPALLFIRLFCWQRMSFEKKLSCMAFADIACDLSGWLCLRESPLIPRGFFFIPETFPDDKAKPRGFAPNDPRRLP